MSFQGPQDGNAKQRHPVRATHVCPPVSDRDRRITRPAVVTRKALNALTEALVPRSIDLCPPVEADVAAGVAAMMTHLAGSIRVALFGYLLMLEYCIPSVYGQRARFSNLDCAKRQAILRRCLHSRSSLTRDLTRVMNALVAVHFYDYPHVRDHLNYAIETHVRRVNSRQSDSATNSPDSLGGQAL